MTTPGILVQKIVVEDGDGRYPIRPHHIDPTRQFYDAFGSTEAEASAALIVRYCQRNGGWQPFSLDALDLFYATEGEWRGFLFNGLDDRGFIIPKGPLLTVTHEFVCRCFLASLAGAMAKRGVM